MDTLIEQFYAVISFIWCGYFWWDWFFSGGVFKVGVPYTMVDQFSCKAKTPQHEGGHCLFPRAACQGGETPFQGVIRKWCPWESTQTCNLQFLEGGLTENLVLSGGGKETVISSHHLLCDPGPNLSADGSWVPVAQIPICPRSLPCQM